MRGHVRRTVTIPFISRVTPSVLCISFPPDASRRKKLNEIIIIKAALLWTQHAGWSIGSRY